MVTRSSATVESRTCGIGHRRRRWGVSVAAPLAIAIFVLATAGCSTTHVSVPEPDPVTEYREQNKATHTFFWGLVQNPQTVIAENCASNALDEVRVSTNFGFALVTVLSLGIWQPLEVNWRCAQAPDTGSGEI
jgi:hypothetical protein